MASKLHFKKSYKQQRNVIDLWQKSDEKYDIMIPKLYRFVLLITSVYLNNQEFLQ